MLMCLLFVTFLTRDFLIREIIVKFDAIKLVSVEVLSEFYLYLIGYHIRVFNDVSTFLRVKQGKTA